MTQHIRPATWLILCCTACLTAVAYLPGLHGGFLFDDFANLPALGDTGPITRWDTFWRYLTSGTADPTGRPLALLSFLLDARDWPANPYPFKRTNLVIHLLNGGLLFLLLRRLGRAFTSPEQDHARLDVAAVLGASLWMAHPLLVSTTLYIVQREAMLPATFTLLGLLTWLRGRENMARGALWSGRAWIAVGLGICTGAALMSKANGILLPALALTLEFALLRPCERAAHRATPPRTYARIMLLFGWLPTLLISAYLLHAGWHGISAGISDARPWTLAQRLLTEPRVLITYLHMLWLPTPFTAGLFNDQVRASTSLLHPWTTVPSLAVVGALVAFAWVGRSRWPAFAAAVLFFFVGQSIESSTIALELFFEHRNYLPALLMFWPLALWLCDAVPGAARVYATPPARRIGWPRPKQALAAACLAGLLLMTWSRASLWGDTHDQSLLWARMNPASARAQAFAAQAELRAGRPDLAIRRLTPALGRAPDQVQLALNLLAARCAAGNLDRDTLASAEHALATTRDTGSLLTSWFGRAINEASSGECPALGLPQIEQLLLAARQNPQLASNPGREQDIYYLLGLIAIRQHDPDRALTLFNTGMRKQPRESLALSQAAELGAAGFPARGLAHLAYFQSLPPPPKASGWDMARLHAYVLARQDYWPRELARLRDTLQQDLQDSDAPSG